LNTNYIDLSTTLRNENLLKTEALFAAQKHHCFTAFSDHFNSICTKITNQQNNSTLPAISRIDYTMLHTNFINRRYIAEVWVYGEDLYLDKNQRKIGEYDISFLFIHFDELWNKLLAQRKRYVGKVRAQEVKTIIMQALPDFYSYLTNIARFAITDILDKKPFIDIIKNDPFKVTVGEYMARTEPIYVESKNKDVKELAEWFDERLENTYTFEDYSDLDFSAHFFTYTEFRYSHFRRSNFNNATLEGSTLIGTSFYRAQMENCCLNNSSIYEADFSYANLKNASFINARGRAGLPNKEEWRHVGFLPVSFRYADLTNADFTGANLIGADFTGAILEGVDFTGAVLDGAIFDSNIAGLIR